MTNYNNAAAFAKGFEALSGLLNMFLQNQIQDDNYEKRLQDSVATNMYNNAVSSRGDLYRPVTEQEVAGHKFSAVANNPTGDIDTNDFQKLRAGKLSYVPRPTSVTDVGNNYRVALDPNSAKLINRVYKTNYKTGDIVPYSLFSGVSTMSNTQDKISNTGNITPKEAGRQIQAGFTKYMADNKMNYLNDDNKLKQAFNDYLQNNSMARYYAGFLGDDGAKMLFGELKNNSQQQNNGNMTTKSGKKYTVTEIK